MSTRKLQLMFSAASLCISIAILGLILVSSVRSSVDGVLVDFSRGRGLYLALAVILLIASLYMVRRCTRAPVAEALETGREEPTSPSSPPEEVEPGSTAAEETEDLLSLLEPDELRLYEMVKDAGGEILQMHLVSARVFSKAKVTRLLDKLENRGLVVRERHGMTNRIRIVK